MTTHLRARALQAGAFLALIGGVLVAAPAPASADAPTVAVAGLRPDSIPSGGETTIEFQVTNPNDDDPGVEVTVSARGMSCASRCRFTEPIPVGSSATLSATLRHTGSVDPGETETIQVRVTAKAGNGNDNTGSATQDLVVRGPDKPQSVRQVSGRVKDQDGKGLAGAAVGLRDSKQQVFETTSNGDGGFSFTSSDAKPIAVGELFVGAAKQGYETVSVKAQGKAGKSITVPLTIKSNTTPSPSPSPSPSPTVTTEPAEEATDEETGPAADESGAAIDAATKSAEDEGSGSLLFIILGGLLVAAGIGAIVLVLMRRKSSEDADEQADGAAAGGAVPAPAGRYGGADQTRLAAPVGGRGNDATMIAPRSGAPSIADAPTMIHRTAPPIDEFPDPYGAPMPQGGSYNAPGGWGTAGAAGAVGAAGAAGAYGAANQYGGGAPAPTQHGGYADQADHGYAGNGYEPVQPAGYGEQEAYEQAGYAAPEGYDQPQQRYDEPTGMYRPEPAAGAGYPQEAGYGDQAGYGGYPQGGGDYADPAAPAVPYQGGNGYQDGAAYPADAEPDGWGGAGSGNAYGAPAGGGTYGAAQGGGTYGGGQTYGGAAPPATYGAPAGGGYSGDPAGYDPRATYGPEGYDQPAAGRGQQPPQGGYGDQGGYAAGADQTGYYGGPDQQGGRHGGQPRPQPPEVPLPGQRRPHDWIED